MNCIFFYWRSRLWFKLFSKLHASKFFESLGLMAAFSWESASAFRQPASRSGTGAFQYRTRFSLFPYRTVVPASAFFSWCWKAGILALRKQLYDGGEVYPTRLGNFFPKVNGIITVEYLAEARLEVSCSSFMSLIFCTSQLHLDNNCWFFMYFKKKQKRKD